MNPILDELKVFTGNGHPQLARSVCEYLGIPLGQAEVFKFANDNTFVRIHENIRQRDVFIIQPTCYPVNDNLMELLIMIDACKRASAGRITAVVPYYGYGRTDKKDQPRVPITARLVADLLTAAGADRLLTIDLHAGQIQGFFNIPVDELTTLPLLGDYFAAKEIQDLVVVAVDIGISKKARDIAERLGAPLAIIEKRRMSNNDVSETMNVIGEVEGKIALVNDRFAEMSDYSVEDAIGMVPSDMNSPEERERADARVRAITAGSPEPPAEFSLLRKDGRLLPINVHSKAIQHDGKPAILTVVRDISQQRLAEEARQASEHRYRTLYELASDAFLNVLPDGEILDANVAAATL
ncbi:MAG: ribose-phosphate diphosphokinase, partial [Chloroflexi bacterium]|nr:ribose-phosphate diphosphokinase [Chloroflexota bacterium]